jgi:hypothetical protein
MGGTILNLSLESAIRIDEPEFSSPNLRASAS